jgi:Uma2 family endonuclease
MSATTTTARGLTLADYLEMPETNQPQEIVNGELIIMPGASGSHQRTSLRIARLLQDHLESSGRGLVYQAPMDVLIREEPFTYRQPDVFFVPREELEQHPGYDDSVPLRARPCLVVEVLSASNRPGEMAGRLRDYAAIGVAEVWLVSLDDRNVEVLRLRGGQYETAGVYRGDETLESSLLPGPAPRAGELFPE